MQITKKKTYFVTMSEAEKENVQTGLVKLLHVSQSLCDDEPLNEAERDALNNLRAALISEV